jgi:hypothetical protein
VNEEDDMKTSNILFLGSVVLALVACGDSSNSTGGEGGDDTSTTQSNSSSTTGTPASTSSGNDGGGGSGEGAGDVGGAGGQGGEGGEGPPAVPELGDQLERMGRPAINTATIDTFLFLTDQGSPAPSNSTVRNESEDSYNAVDAFTPEAAGFITTQALQLTVLDSLDGVCGNQPLWGFNAEAGTCDDSATGDPLVCYGTLATVLNNDALFVKTNAEGSCAIYLGVEADTAALLGSDALPANDDCGGRRPIDDVIRTTYSVVAGVLDAEGETLEDIFGFDDQIDAPDDLHPAEFPYFAPPAE